MPDPGPEELVVVGLMQDPRRTAEVLSFDPAWFETPECRVLFQAALSVHRRAASQGLIRYATRASAERRVEEWEAAAPDRDAAKRRMSIRGAAQRLLDESRSAEYLGEHDFRDACDEVRRAAMDSLAKKGLMRVADHVLRNGAAGAARELADLSREISAVGNAAGQVGTLSADARGVIVDYLRAKRDPGSVGIPTFLPRLDQLTGGGRKGRMWLTCAFAKEGKTQAAKDLVYHASVAAGKGAVVFTAEQTRADVRTMMVVRHSHRFHPGGLLYERVNNGTLTPQEERALRATVQDLEGGGYGPVSYFQAPEGTTMADIRAVAESVSRRHPVDVLMLDHTLLFEPSDADPRMQERVRVSRVIRQAKALALDFDGGRGLWVIACHQINRDGKEAAEKRGYYVPMDAAETAEAERSADVMFWLLRTEELRDVSEIRVGVALNRWGEIDVKGWHVAERFRSAALLPIEEGP